MQHPDSRSYHEERAEAELLLASQASEPAIAQVHRELAALHRRQMMEIVKTAPAIAPFPEPADY